MARSYKRDGSGRFAGGGGGGGGKGGGGSKAKGGSAKPKAAAKPAAPKAAPKTTTARGRAKTKATQARQAMKAGGNQSKAARSLNTAQRAADYYKATGTGTKRSATKASGGSKPAKAVMAKTAPKPQAAPSKKRSLPKTSRPGTIKGKVTRNPSAGKKLAAMKAKRTPAIVRAVAAAGAGAYVAGQAARARVNKAVAGIRKGAAGRGRKR